tara:strand:+ start:107 stop:640 length:534 start_codon:yes stop_codon:yes gene_type:complete
MYCGPDATTHSDKKVTYHTVGVSGDLLHLHYISGDVRCLINDISCCCPKPVLCVDISDQSCNQCCELQYINYKGGVQLNRTTVFNRQYAVGKKNVNPLKKNRNQRGRWNTSSTNTKLFPAISTGHAYGSPEDMNIITSSPTVVKQSKNLFSNTTHHMTKREILSYLSRNGRGRSCLR